MCVRVCPSEGGGSRGEEGRCVDAAAAWLQGIDVRRELAVGTGDAVYLETVRGALKEAFERCQPDLVIYNAGTDILAGEHSCEGSAWACRMQAVCIHPIDDARMCVQLF